MKKILALIPAATALQACASQPVPTQPAAISAYFDNAGRDDELSGCRALSDQSSSARPEV